METSKILDQASALTSTALSKFFADELIILFAGETRLTQTLPYIQLSANAEMLKQIFGDYILQTQKQTERLEKILESLSINPAGGSCVTMEALISETNEIIEKTPPGSSNSGAKDRAL
jgi:ferritin-like metal-binding protein YciE